MFKLANLILVAACVIVVGCSPAEKYPLSGEQCGPKDPVLDLDASDCVIAPI